MSGKVTFTTGSFTGEIGTDAEGNIFMNTQNKAKKILFDDSFGITGSAGAKYAFLQSGSKQVRLEVGAQTGDLKIKKIDGTELMRVKQAAALQITGSNFQGDISASNFIYAGNSSSGGIILTSPNGTKYRLKVDNSGNLSTQAL